MLRHPADSMQLMNIERIYHELTADQRNMMICLCMDGMNLFRNMNLLG